jgi:serine/threonine-protein kinase
MPLPNGATFAGFTIIRLLGSGGMGEVYLAQHPRLPRRDALKLLPLEWSADEEYRTRFTREADLASTLWHPHIVGVHDRGEADRQLWISMDFVDGLDGARLLADRYPAGMPVEEVVRIVTAVASGLDYAHKQGLLHRDVKPANIMLTHLNDDGEQRVLLADFGIARNLDDISGLTTTNMTVGTVAYAAPEQLMGETVDGRADQYALAATAYHLLTGSQLFPHSNPAVVISRHLNSDPPALAERRPELANLDLVLARALAKNPEDRFARCSDLARAFAEQVSSGSFSFAAAPAVHAPAGWRGGPTDRPAPSTTPKRRPPAERLRRHRLVAAAVVAVIIVGVVILVWRPWSEGQSTSAPASSTLSSGASLTNSGAVPPPVPASSPTTTAAPVALPNEPPQDSGCQGVVIGHNDLEHPNLGTVRVFLFLNTSTSSGDSVGCVLPVTRSGRVLPTIPIDGQEKLAFANPATDATGNMFITYDPGRYPGVLVLIPDADGFEDIGWDAEMSGTHYMGKHAYYYADLVGPNSSDLYTIRQSRNDCTPSCADGTTTSQDLHWNGSDYVA